MKKQEGIHSIVWEYLGLTFAVARDNTIVTISIRMFGGWRPIFNFPCTDEEEAKILMELLTEARV